MVSKGGPDGVLSESEGSRENNLSGCAGVLGGSHLLRASDAVKERKPRDKSARG